MNFTLEDRAAEWIVRRDAGLSVAERSEFRRWLAADPRHAAALARGQQLWDALDVLADWRPRRTGPPDPDLLLRPFRRRRPPAAAPAGLDRGGLQAPRPRPARNPGDEVSFGRAMHQFHPWRMIPGRVRASAPGPVVARRRIGRPRPGMPQPDAPP